MKLGFFHATFLERAVSRDCGWNTASKRDISLKVTACDMSKM